MPTFTMTKNWNDGTTLTESQLDDIKSSVETFLNTTKLDADNLQDSAVTTAKIAANAVTETKIATSVAGAGLTGGAGSALAVNPDGTTLEISSDAVRIKDLGVSTAKLANDAVTSEKVADDINLPGDLVKAGDQAVVVSQANDTVSSALIWGIVAAAGTVAEGVGYTAARPGTGTYNVAFNSPFAASPAVVVTPYLTTTDIGLSNIDENGFSLTVNLVGGGAATNTAFTFIAMGRKAT